MEGTEILLKGIEELEKRVANMEAEVKHLNKAVEITSGVTIENRDGIKRLQDTVLGMNENNNNNFRAINETFASVDEATAYLANEIDTLEKAVTEQFDEMEGNK